MCRKGHPPPNPSDPINNTCGNIGDIIKGNYFCTIVPPSGLKSRENYCHSITPTGEWGYYSVGDSCLFDTCQNTRAVGSGCCNGCCAIFGKGVKCVRNYFTANPVTCCFQDYFCTNVLDDCYQDPDRRSTCSPDTRNLGSISCQSSLENLCSGFDSNNWTKAWISMDIGDAKYPQIIQNPCPKAIRRIVTNLCGINDLSLITPSLINPTGFVWAQNVMFNVINNYIKDYGSLLTPIDSNGSQKAAVANTILSLCNELPGLCVPALNNMCATVKPSDFFQNINSLVWCGCYMPDEQYLSYIELGVTKECTPFCNRLESIPLATPNGLDTALCKENICLMDDISLNVIDSNYNNINFGQLCSGCGNIKESNQNQIMKNENVSYRRTNQKISGSRCDCLMQDSTYTIINSTVNNINLTQNCGSTHCYNNSNENVDCETGEIIGPSNEINKKSIYTTAFLGIGVISIVMLLWILMSPKRK
jgi:hypothetical protein